MRAITVLNLLTDFVILADLICLFTLGRSLGIIFDCPEDPLLGALILEYTGVHVEPLLLWSVCFGLLLLCSFLIIKFESQKPKVLS